MMWEALALATALTAAGPLDATHQESRVLQLVRTACVETGMQRTAFERLARERRWRRARVTSDSGETGGWNLMFRAEGAHVMLSSVPGFGEAASPVASICSVSVDRAPPSLEQEVAAFAASLGLESDPMGDNFPSAAGPVRTWSRLGDSTLTYATSPDGRAVISLSRQVVISTVTSVSPAQP